MWVFLAIKHDFINVFLFFRNLATRVLLLVFAMKMAMTDSRAESL